MIAPITPIPAVESDQPDDTDFQRFPNWSVGIYLYYDADEAIEAARLLLAEGRHSVRISVRYSAGGLRTPWRTVRPQHSPAIPKAKNPIQNSGQGVKVDQEVAKAVGVSHDTVHQVAPVISLPEAIEQMPKGQQEILTAVVGLMRVIRTSSLTELIQFISKAEQLASQEVAA